MRLPAATSPLSASTAAESVIRMWAEKRGGEPTEDLAQLYRRARGGAHPDNQAGRREGWNEVESAAAVLRSSGRL